MSVAEIENPVGKNGESFEDCNDDSASDKDCSSGGTGEEDPWK